MKRENRYTVLKMSDVNDALSDGEKRALKDICDRLRFHRICIGKQELRCVVVESDWPEYEPVWNMIERRMDSSNATGEFPAAQKHKEKA